MSLIPYHQYVNRPNGAGPPWYNPNMPGLVGARNLDILRTMAPETFRRLYRRYNHRIRSWEIKTGIAIANRVARSPVPANIPESDLFLPASAWYLSSAEGIAFAQRVWIEWARGGKAVWSVAGAGPMPGYTCVRAALPGPQAGLIGPPPNLTVTGDTDDEDDEDSDED